jgi:hypothetical protein
MKSILRALALTGVLSLGAAGAQAQTRVFVGFRTPIVAAIPPCPGDGYIWTAGYYDGPVFVPGRWIYRGFDRDGFRARGDWDRGYYRAYDRDRDFHRNYDRHDRDGFRDHDRR